MVSLGTLFLACQFADLLWPTFLMLGIEIVEIDPGNTLVTPLNFVSYPYSHSLVVLLVWSALFALLYRAMRGGAALAIVTVAALVFSHYLLDVITHRPDMPITLTGRAALGFGLWNYPGTTLAIESAMFIIGTTIYIERDARARSNRPRRLVRADRVARSRCISRRSTVRRRPTPPPIAIAGHLSWLFVLWAYWVDRHRQPRRAA